MKMKFVKTTLTLSLLLMAAAPTQAFASTNTGCNLSVPLNQQVVVKDLNSLLANNSCLKNLNLNIAPGKDCQKIILQQFTNLKNYTTAPTTQTTKPTTTTTQVTTKPTTTTQATKPTTTTTQTTTKPTTTTQQQTTTPSQTTTNTNTSNTAGIGSYEQQVANIVNQERAKAGLAPLTLSNDLSKVAEAKAADMMNNNYFSHTSPTYGSPFDMMKQFGISYTSAGENIAMGQQTPQSVMDAWMNSSGHRANILNSSYGKIGVGYVKGSNGTTYWVQEFTN